jgi:hypothetical protein
MLPLVRQAVAPGCSHRRRFGFRKKGARREWQAQPVKEASSRVLLPKNEVPRGH